MTCATISAYFQSKLKKNMLKFDELNEVELEKARKSLYLSATSLVVLYISGPYIFGQFQEMLKG